MEVTLNTKRISNLGRIPTKKEQIRFGIRFLKEIGAYDTFISSEKKHSYNILSSNDKTFEQNVINYCIKYNLRVSEFISSLVKTSLNSDYLFWCAVSNMLTRILKMCVGDKVKEKNKVSRRRRKKNKKKQIKYHG